MEVLDASAMGLLHERSHLFLPHRLETGESPHPSQLELTTAVLSSILAKYPVGAQVPTVALETEKLPTKPHQS